MRLRNPKLGRVLPPILAGAACMIAMLSVVHGVTDWENTRPHIGDMIAFRPSGNRPAQATTRLSVSKPDRTGCVLDLSLLQQAGGSFVVERRLANDDGQFVVHWAGQRTAEDAGDCGGRADLLLTTYEIDVLGAGARGVDGDTAFASFSSK